jgi:hypothetical protein
MNWPHIMMRLQFNRAFNLKSSLIGQSRMVSVVLAVNSGWLLTNLLKFLVNNDLNLISLFLLIHFVEGKAGKTVFITKQ